MKLETKAITNKPVGPKDRQKLEGIAVSAIHNGKVVMWRVMAPDTAEVERITKIVSNLNKMIGILAQSFPELIDKPPKPVKTVKKHGRSTDSKSS